MKQIKWTLLLWAVMGVCASCETVIDLSELNDYNVGDIVINGIVSPDSLFTAYISKAYSSPDAPFIALREYDDEGFWVPSEYWDSHRYNFDALKMYAQCTASVQLLVNDRDEYSMAYDSTTYMYHSNYRPQEGDHVLLKVTNDDGEVATAETTVLPSQKLDILEYEVKYENLSIESNNNEWLVALPGDTAVYLKLRLTDPGNEENFYRLKVRNLRKYNTDGDKEYYNCQELFKSDDVIFKDNRLVRGWGGWSAYFSNVFDDHLFNGKEYTFELKTSLYPIGDTTYKRYLIIELQSMPKDYYYYLKSMLLYRITLDSDFAESSYLHSNVENGWGFLGSLNGEKHIIEL